jgi:hypothetical protein
MQDVSPHALIQSFISGLSDFLNTFSGVREKETFSVSICAGTGTQVAWTADVACVLRGCYFVQGGGNANTISRTKVGAPNAAGQTTARQIISFFSGTTQFMQSLHRESFGIGDKIWLVNASAGTTVLLLVFET